MARARRSTQDAAVPVASCEQRQQDFVNKLIAADQQVDVGATVHAVLETADFPQAMPY
jgi:hypothetical protein